MELGIKNYRDLKEARNSQFAGAQGAEVRNEEALRVLNPQGRGVKGISSPPQWERAESTRFSHAEESSPHVLPGVKQEKESSVQ